MAKRRPYGRPPAAIKAARHKEYPAHILTRTINAQYPRKKADLFKQACEIKGVMQAEVLRNAADAVIIEVIGQDRFDKLEQVIKEEKEQIKDKFPHCLYPDQVGRYQRQQAKARANEEQDKQAD